MRVVVTGASQGIGAAIAEAFAAEPDTRIAVVARNRENLERTAATCRAVGATVECFPCDLTDADGVAEMAESVLQQIGVPEILVNNAGRFEPASFAETTLEVFRRQLEVNLTSAFLVTRAFLPRMLEAGAGDLFFLASVASIRGYAGGAAYCAAKHGLLGLARVIREETLDTGIRVTSVLPGAVRTPSWDGLEIPENRFMPPQDIARAIVDVSRLTNRTVVEEILLRPQPGELST